MASTIKHVPVLEGKAAERFEAIAQQNNEKKGTIDFSKERAMASKILASAKF